MLLTGAFGESARSGKNHRPQEQHVFLPSAARVATNWRPRGITSGGLKQTPSRISSSSTCWQPTKAPIGHRQYLAKLFFAPTRNGQKPGSGCPTHRPTCRKRLPETNKCGILGRGSPPFHKPANTMHRPAKRPREAWIGEGARSKGSGNPHEME